MVQHREGNHDYLTLPGGGLEPGETPEQAAVREVREETGLVVRLGPMLFDEEYEQSGRPAISRCFLGTKRPWARAHLGFDPEDRGRRSTDRMLQGLVWARVRDLALDRQVSLVRRALKKGHFP